MWKERATGRSKFVLLNNKCVRNFLLHLFLWGKSEKLIDFLYLLMRNNQSEALLINTGDFFTGVPENVYGRGGRCLAYFIDPKILVETLQS